MYSAYYFCVPKICDFAAGAGMYSAYYFLLCAVEQLAQSNLHQNACAEQLAPSNLRRAACAEQLAHTRLSMLSGQSSSSCSLFVFVFSWFCSLVVPFVLLARTQAIKN